MRAPDDTTPDALPDGERVLWRGKPRWRSLARRAFHVRAVIVYFGALLGWLAASSWNAGGVPSRGVVLAGLVLAGLAVAATGILALLAWLTARSTTYVVTTRRVVMYFGVALPMTVNVPFKIVRAAGVRTFPDGTADIPLTLGGEDRIGYVHLWPHVRPWQLSRPQPMLRAVPDGAAVAAVLGGALAASAGQAALELVPSAKATGDAGRPNVRIPVPVAVPAVAA